MSWVLISTILLCIPVKAGRGQSGDLNSSTPGLGLPPLLTAALAFYIICAILAATQVILLAHNTTRRLSKELPSIALPQKYAGPIFPIFLLLASLTFMVFNVIEASSLATTNKFNLPLIGRPELTQSYSTAAAVMGYLADILLVSCAFVLLTHREKILRITSPMACRIKMAYDAILTVVLFALSMARVGLKAVAVTSAEVRVSNNVYLAYHYTLLVTVANIALSSIILHIRTKRSRVDDHKISRLSAVIVAPLLVLYAVYAIVIWNFDISNTVLALGQVVLASAVVSSAVRLTIIMTYVTFEIWS